MQSLFIQSWPRSICSLVAICLVLPTHVSAAGPVDCRTAGCHAAFESMQFVHRPLEDPDCGGCHPATPETTAHPRLAEAATDASFSVASLPECGRCHETPAPDHSADSSRCTDCHDPHGGSTPALLRGTGESLCAGCHADAFEGLGLPGAVSRQTQDGVANPDVRLHGPVAEGRCSPCHLIHDGALRGDFPARPYARYERARYSACLNACHDPALVEEASTTKSTGFRNGPDNLHYRHVAAPERGRSCSLCHVSHGSKARGLVRRGMPYGLETLTLEFAPSTSGGSCATSCHMPLQYDRQRATPSRMRTPVPAEKAFEESAR